VKIYQILLLILSVQFNASNKSFQSRKFYWNKQ